MKMRTLAGLVLTVLVVGCGGLPDQLRQSAQALPAQIDSTRAEVQQLQQQFQQFKQRSEFAAYKPYAQKENWASAFDSARGLIQKAEGRYQDKIKPLVKKDEEKSAQLIRTNIRLTENTLKDALEAAKRPQRRRSFLDEARSNAAQWTQQARQRAQRADTLVAHLSEVADSVKADHGNKQKDIDSKVAQVGQRRDSIQARLEIVQTQLERHRAEDQQADYAALGDGVRFIRERTQKLAEQTRKYQGMFDQLYRSYEKVLVDMRIDRWVQVGRSAWNDNNYGEQKYTYPRSEVPEETYQYLIEAAREGQLRDATIAWLKPGFGGSELKLKIPQKHWDAIGIDYKRNWQGNNNEAQYWLHNWGGEFYHKYAVIENGEMQESDWQKVSSEFFWDHERDLGMAIVSKPYGQYEADKLTKSTPPGLAKVGNEHYGEWQRDEDGDRFWSWYGRYHFYSSLLGGHRYRYGEWNRWHTDYRGNRPYYGKRGNQDARYGTWGTRTKSTTRYTRTTYGKRQGWGGRRTTVRGAGATVRGRGPGAGK